MGKFMVGFLVGAAVGAGVALILSSRQQHEGFVATLQQHMHTMLDEARRAATLREAELWQEFYQRIPEAKQPPMA